MTSTPKPVRLHRRRDKGFRLTSPNGLPIVCVTRPGKWGNPFSIGKDGPMGRKPIDSVGAVGFFADMLRDEQLRAASRYPSVDEIRQELRGKNLACFCPPFQPCHADILLEIANSPN